MEGSVIGLNRQKTNSVWADFTEGFLFLFYREFNKALLPVGRGGGVLLSEILHLLCKQMSHKKVAALWRETGLRWKDLLPDGEDVQSFVSEK
ncbi:hypothetical protein AB205_0160040, partial [Aquarana catesbeiana]